jgi:predicted GH43/DUF377 family glycosyl hydrolase
MLSWKKLGRVFNPATDGVGPWMREFAQCPTPFLLDERTLRVFISCRPARDGEAMYVSHPAYVDLDRSDPTRLLRVSPKPLLPLGGMGAFDEFGVMPCSVVRRGETLYMYYTGWTRMSSVPYTVGIGVAVSHDGGESFERIGDGPVLGLTLNEPYLVNSPAVKIIDELWHMWYLTGTGWLRTQGRPEPTFHVVHATSTDGIHWRRDGKPVLRAGSEDECQDIFLPFHHGERWHAVFAHRKPLGFRTDPASMYRLGYASSTDLVHWDRDDNRAGISVEDSGWDSQMLCSTQVVDVDGRMLMFYCGNEIGRWGFGIAELNGD